MDIDPVHWTVEQVCDFFRRDAQRYLSDLPNSRLPDLEPFLQALQEENVFGSVLLTAVDTSTLRDEFNVKSLVARSAVVHCIRKLTAQSAVYRIKKEDVDVPETPKSIGDSTLAPPPVSADLPAPVPVHTSDSKDAPILSEQPRPGEVQIQDERGRKRRKLDLTTSAQVESTKAPQSPSKSAGYFGDSSLPVDHIFYGNTRLGYEVKDYPTNPDFTVLEHDQERDLGETNFQFCYPDKPAGESEYVNRRIMPFLKADEFALIRHGRDAAVKFPYQKSFSAAMGKTQSAMVFEFRGTSDQMVTYRENGQYLENGDDYHNQPQESETGTWDFLKTKYDAQHGSEVLSSYHGSRAASITSSLADQIEEEQNEMEERKTLTREESKVVVSEQIEKFVSEWQTYRLPRLEEKSAWSIWKKTKQSTKIRASLIQDAKARVENYDQRLLKQRSRFEENDDWKNADELAKVCEVMRSTIEDRELELWKTEVWQRKVEPHHVARHGGHSNTNAHISSTAKNHPFVPEPSDRFSVEPAQHEDMDKALDNPQDTPGLVEHDEMDQSLDGPQATPSAQSDDDDQFVVQDLETGTPYISDQSDQLEATPDLFDDGALSSHTVDHNLSTPIKPVLDLSLDSDASLPDLQSFIRKHSPKPDFVTPSKPASATKAAADVIELSSDSATPSSSKVKIKKTSSQRQKFDDSTPENASASEVASWDMEDLVDNQDRKRIIIKILHDAGEEMRGRIKAVWMELRLNLFKLAVADALRNLKMTLTYRGQDEQSTTVLFCAKLALVWTCLKPEIMDGHFPKRIDWEAVFRDFGMAFLPHFKTIIDKLSSNLFNQPPRSSAKTVEIYSLLSSDEEADLSPRRLAKKAKKAKLNTKALESQAAAHIRQQKFKDKGLQASNSQQLEALVRGDPSKSAVPVNPIKEDDEEFIFVDEKIAATMKDHQKEGVQFMWRELTAVDDEGVSQGCILAHTMGLGKTMQTIALLVALNEAARSEDPRVRSQLPPRLQLKRKALESGRQLRVLVLAPVVLLQNWRRELKKWAPEKLPYIWTVERDATRTTAHQNAFHMQNMKEWYKFGGVLLMGYPLFLRKTTRKDDEPTEEDEKIQKFLLKGTEVLVADEAHNLKDEKAKTSVAVKGIHTQSRIALTGTPMSNDVQEIYSLVSFAAPNYLGDPGYFRQRFANPIREGNGRDSTRQQVRNALKKLVVLRNQIEPKVNRADITVLRGSLKSKTEFVIRLPLLGVQHAAYLKYLKALLGGGKNDKASQVTMFGWLAVLTLLCNHPLAFKRKLNAPVTYKPNKGKKAARVESEVEADSGGNTPLRVDDDDSVEVVDDEDLSKSMRTLGFDEETIKDITADISDDLDTILSAKITTLISILELSKACGDKVLVFTTSIPTLDYVEQALGYEGFKTARIDGKVLPVAKRQTIIDKFQQDDTTALLISTRAGGVGLDIQGANRVVILDFGFNPAHEEQAVGRAYRLGQPKPVFVYRLVVGGTFEDMIQNTQLFKTSLTQRVVDKKNPARNATLAVRDYLFEPNEVPQEDLHQWMGKDEQVLDKMLNRQVAEQDDAGGLIRHITTIEVLQEEGQDEALTAEEALEVEEEIRVQRSTRAQRKNAVGGLGRIPPLTAPANAAGGVARVPSSTAPAAGMSMQHAYQNHQAAQLAQHGYEPHGINMPSSSARPGLMRLPIPSTVPHGLPNVPHGLPNS